MPAHIRSASGSGGWKSISSMFIKTVAGSGGWKNITQGWIRISQGVGGWRQFFSSVLTPVIEQKVLIAKSSPINNTSYHNSTYPVTLIGTKYHFQNANTFAYQFLKSSDGVNFTPIQLTPVSTTNPSSGSSSTVTYQLQNSDFDSVTMYFKFLYTATNTTFGTTGTSTSDSSTSVIYLDIPAPPPGFPNINQSTISVESTANSGTWIGSPTLYDWKWQYGPSNLTLTYQATPSISSISLSGTTATATVFNHGFKSGDTVTVSGVNALFNQSSNTISSVFTNLFSYTVSKPAHSFSTNYSAGQFVTYGGQIYISLLATPTPRTNWNSSTTYTSGQYVNSGGNLWQAVGTNVNQTPFFGSDFWDLIDIYPTSTTYWQSQNGSTASGGTATGPNYYEGSSSSPISYTINSFPSTDYKTGTSLLSLTTRMNVAAYNAAFNSSANSIARTIYGYPSFFFGAQTITGTTASIIYAEANMSVYDIDVKIGASSISGYPKTNQANSSPISITGLSPGTTYTVLVTPKNADSPRVSGVQKTTSFTTPNPPGTPTITFSSVNTGGFTVSWSASGATSYTVDVKNTSSGLTIGGYPKINTTLTSDTITGLLSGTNYTVYVTGKNSSGDGPQANNNQYTNVTLSYNGNSNTGGSVPSSGQFSYNATATVQGNPNSLSRTYATWAGWTLSSDGSGTVYGPGFTTTIQMNQDRTLYAKWNANIPGTPSINSVSYSPASPTTSSNSLVFSGINFGSDTQSVLVEWGTTTAYSSGSTSVSTNGGSYTTPANLSANTTYYWRARGYNPLYNGYGSPVTGSIFIPQAQIAPNNGTATISLQSGTSGRVGAVFSATGSAQGSPTPTISGYQWQYYIASTDSWTNVPSGGTSSTYTTAFRTTTYTDVGKTFRCLITFSNGVSPNLTVTSSNTLSIANPTITSIQSYYRTTATLNPTTAGGAPKRPPTTDGSSYVVWYVFGYNFQSINTRTVINGTTQVSTTTSDSQNIDPLSVGIYRQTAVGGSGQTYVLRVDPRVFPQGGGFNGTMYATNSVTLNSTNQTNSPITNSLNVIFSL
jgi:uncharacterized repeat protein (TIGR02543 family)